MVKECIKRRIEEEGGPAAFVTAWLDHASTDKTWRIHEMNARQLCLF